MADRADLYIHNRSMDDINVIRKLPDGSSDLDITIARGNSEFFHLPGPEVSLNINAPYGVDIRDYSIKVRADVDVMTMSSRTESRWTINIVPNDLPPETPLTVNVSVGEDEPE
ncbi:MAG: hypothetical protein GTO45_11305 [Candidatus Aminicenantes bacterium]|nr:hypothetical protein [Candidatus Aminicenantes bacterium]NIM82384.1 hypothetical protein [Candidatus Aminicenantes bacterium]NIN21774.1 hypothetical protein [Candidatus Aminicenantes bacterium]NIN42571.1 hypothetical protein [Candidatus Aminicenantes bacterium]NIN85337.1 hypothetical protein [Candidatus Aminicenantes bacterium]